MVARPVQNSDLHAYVDGWLDPQRRLEVEAYLAEDPEAAERVKGFRAQNQGLHALFDNALREPPSPGMIQLRERLAGRIAGNDNRGWLASPFMRMAAAVALLITGATGGYLLKPAQVIVREQPALQSFAQEAVQAHAFYATDHRFAVEMGAEDRSALDRWLSQRLGRDIFAPDLSGVGYHLIGGRSLPIATGAGAQYMYENDAQRRLTLFVGTPKTGQDAAFSFVQQDDIAMFYWLEGPLAYAAIGRVQREELMEVAKAVSEQVKTNRTATQSPPRPAAPAQATPGDNSQTPPGVQPASEIKPKQM